MSKILVAEDNTANLELIREILQLHGFGLFHQADSLLAIGGLQNLVAVQPGGPSPIWQEQAAAWHLAWENSPSAPDGTLPRQRSKHYWA